MALLKGNSRSIIAQNVRDLCNGGMNQGQATALAMKHARKGTSKKRVDGLAEKVIAATPMKVK